MTLNDYKEEWQRSGMISVETTLCKPTEKWMPITFAQRSFKRFLRKKLGSDWYLQLLKEFEISQVELDEQIKEIEKLNFNNQIKEFIKYKNGKIREFKFQM